jgi:hypothetical protein
MDVMSKSDINCFIRKLYRFLEEGHVIKLKKMKSDRGMIIVKNTVAHITLDPTHKIIPTLIHESLYYFYPSEPEAWILEREEEIVEKLTVRQMRNIITKFAKCL